MTALGVRTVNEKQLIQPEDYFWFSRADYFGRGVPAKLSTRISRKLIDADQYTLARPRSSIPIKRQV